MTTILRATIVFLLLAGAPVVQAQEKPAAGCSLLGLARAGLTLEQGRALGIPIDSARTSGVVANVMRLRQLMAPRST